jgi:hypothetical protein
VEFGLTTSRDQEKLLEGRVRRFFATERAGRPEYNSKAVF